jgi:hypothetical protein
MNDISATGPRDAWAVAQVCGRTCGSTSARIAVEHWDGSDWHWLPVLPGRAQHAENAFVGASSGTDAWVLAESDHGADALHWNGTRWSVERAPACGQVHPVVFGPDNAWAFDGSGTRACAARFDGRRWRKVVLPAIPEGVSAVSKDDIWVLGAAIASQGTGSPRPPVGGILALHWDGHAWMSVRGPIVNLGSNQHLVGGNITALGPRDVWIESGIQTDANPRLAELLAHWDGATWHRVRVPRSYGVWSMAQDGRGGLWLSAEGSSAVGIRWFFYHVRDGRTVAVPASAMRGRSQLYEPAEVAWIPGTASLWGIETVSSPARGSQGAILRYRA